DRVLADADAQARRASAPTEAPAAPVVPAVEPEHRPEPEPAQAVPDEEPEQESTDGPEEGPEEGPAEGDDTSAFVSTQVRWPPGPPVQGYLAEHRRRRRLWIAAVVLFAALVLGAGAVFVTTNLIDDASGDDAPATIASDLVPLPLDVRGRPLTQVAAELDRSGLEAEVERVFDEDVPADDVIALGGVRSPQVPRGSTIGLVVSRGPEPRIVPRIEAGSDIVDAEAALEELGLRVERDYVFHETAPAGAVLAVSHDPDTRVERGATVTVTVSKGPDLVVVPDVVGRPLAEAIAALEAAGVTVGTVHGPSQGVVLDQNPDGGSKARRGASVNLRPAP
ncbi:MAG: PASTA domain-containing protein, partial [Acidimicrobiales bacterium]